MSPTVNSERLQNRLQQLGDVGRDTDGALARIALTDAEKCGRDLLVSWLRDADLDVVIDRIGNIFGIWRAGNPAAAPVMLGSHIDTVVNAGIYDGCYGVIGGLEVIQTLKESGFAPIRPIVVGAFTNEEGARFAPDMMGSLVYAGGMKTDDALAVIGTDGAILGEELARIGYAGAMEPGAIVPEVYLELHIEQGPVLERRGIDIGAVENLQGISWQELEIAGKANHAGTTPMSMRLDAGLAAARVATFLHGLMDGGSQGGVATIGTLSLKPNVINVIPNRATFTVDLRNPDEGKLLAAEAALATFLEDLRTEGFTISTRRLARFEPVAFDQKICAEIETAAQVRGLSVIRMTSGAGHDAQMMARICPSAMVFVPSRGGVSHNPREYTEPEQLVAGANVFLDIVRQAASV